MHDADGKLRRANLLYVEGGPASSHARLHDNTVELLQNDWHSLGEGEHTVVEMICKRAGDYPHT